MISALLTYAIALWGSVRKRSKFLLSLLIAISFIMAWLSNDQYDYVNYEFAYYNPQSFMAQRFEYGYQVLMEIGRLGNLDYSQFRAIYSAVALLIIVCALRYYTENINFPLAVGMVFPLIYLYPIQRFFMATAVVLFFSRYLVENSRIGTIKYLIGIVLAGFLHSGCFFFLVIPIYRAFKSKKNFFWIIVGFQIPFIVFAETGLIGKIISILPLGKSVFSAVEKGSRANINGLLEECILVLLVIIPGFLSVYYYFKGKTGAKNSKTDQFMDFMFYVNVITMLIIAIRVYSPAADRLLYIIALMNYTAASITLNLYKGDIRHCSRPALAIAVSTVGGAICLLAIEFYTSPQLKDLIFWMHFNSNPVFSMINSLVGV